MGDELGNVRSFVSSCLLKEAGKLISCRFRRVLKLREVPEDSDGPGGQGQLIQLCLLVSKAEGPKAACAGWGGNPSFAK